jgi:hypothetical protein
MEGRPLRKMWTRPPDCTGLSYACSTPALYFSTKGRHRPVCNPVGRNSCHYSGRTRLRTWRNGGLETQREIREMTVLRYSNQLHNAYELTPVNGDRRISSTQTALERNDDWYPRLLAYPATRFFRAAFFGVVVCRRRFGCVGAAAIGSSATSGSVSIAGSGAALP